MAPERYRALVQELAAKRGAQETLAGDILRNGVPVDHLKAFLESSRAIFHYPGAEGEPCPFCRRPLDSQSVKLVRQYHAFLVDTLQQEITNLSRQITEQGECFRAIQQFRIEPDDALSNVLAPEELTQIAASLESLKSAIPSPLPVNEAPTFGSFASQRTLDEMSVRVKSEADRRDEAIRVALSSKAEHQREIARLTDVCQGYLYRTIFIRERDALQAILDNHKSARAIRELVRLVDFPTILRKMTNAGKEAHSKLIVAEFERQLDKEYSALSGKTLSDFGIRLSPRGEQQEVAVQTQIGDAPIRRVLSEGEQKIHALALFFCETLSQPSDIVVFDDPSTSFDFNHLGSFVERLRDLVQHFPHSQFIIFTHNWEFFVQTQVVFNKAHLSNDMDVKVSASFRSPSRRGCFAAGADAATCGGGRSSPARLSH